eukprot:11926231-Heterocapsa_arctica.AAC.1
MLLVVERVDELVVVKLDPVLRLDAGHLPFARDDRRDCGLRWRDLIIVDLVPVCLDEVVVEVVVVD